ncbi:MAG: hypothetical protein WCO66_02270 [Candidatus Absconditabacteria bacterium]
MLATLDQAKKFIVTKVPEYLGTDLEPGEAELLETLLETDFFDKIEGLVDEKDMEDKHLETDEEVEHYLFQHIPNYTTLLEESVADVISDYLDPEDNE